MDLCGEGGGNLFSLLVVSVYRFYHFTSSKCYHRPGKDEMHPESSKQRFSPALSPLTQIETGTILDLGSNFEETFITIGTVYMETITLSPILTEKMVQTILKIWHYFG